jgi:PAS domain S-box-containing protein
MKLSTSIVEMTAEQRIGTLIRIMREAEQELQALTGGQLDAVAGVGGQPFLLHDAQEKLRQSEGVQRQLAETQNAILDALPAHIALVNCEGLIISVNGAWRRFAGTNALQGAECGVGQNYLTVCERAQGKNAEDGLLVATGLRTVLAGEATDFTLEYPCHAPNEQRWFKLIITPLHQKHSAGAVITHINITERKLSEESLKLFRALIDQSTDAIEVIEPQTGRFLDVNERACQRLGYSRGEMLTLNLTDIEDTAITGSSLSGHVEEIRKTGFKIVEGRHRRKDGSTFPIEASVQYIDLNRGYLVGVVRDITERKNTEAVLRASETRYRSLATATAQIVWTTDADGKVFGALPEWQEFTGQSIEEIQDDGWTDALHPEDRGRAFNIWTEAVRNHMQYDAEYRLRRHDGVYRDFSVRGVPVLSGDGSISEWVGCCMDITESKRSQEQIVEQAALLDKTQDAIIVRDLKGCILFWNKGAEGIFGWLRQDVLGRNIGELLYADSGKYEDINMLTISRGEWSGELAHLTKDRRELAVEGRCTLVRDQKGQPKSVLAIYTDVTEKKKIEAHFMRAQRMESIGTLAGGIAHDLNNILAPILMSIDLLKTQSDSARTTKILQTIEVSAKRGADVVRQVLSFARGLEGQRMEVQPKQLLKDLENIIRSTFPKNIRLHFCIPCNPWAILGDSTQVHQVLLNLCVNARDAMPNGGNLTVSVENFVLDDYYAVIQNHVKPGRYVKINVTDSGIGIPPEVIDKIFEPFFTTKDLGQGTGLGLSTVMAIVKSHQGTINVYSDQGEGTTFSVYFPAMKMSAEALKEQWEPASMPRGNGETVLVVDDDAAVLTVTGQTLEDFGYHVLTATNGADALAIYLQHRNEIAVLLTDMMMPVMDGAATVYALKRINPAIKIIAASGLNAGGKINKVIEGGIKHFLIKPYTARTLLKTLRMILDEV